LRHELRRQLPGRSFVHAGRRLPVNDSIIPITFDDLVKMASRVVIPALFETDAAVSVGQLWLAKWDSFAEFVLITDADESNPVAVPVTFDAIHNIEASELVRSSQLGEARAHWLSSRRMPAIALDSLLDPRVPSTRVRTTETPMADGSDALWNELEPLDVTGSGELPNRLRALKHSPSKLGDLLGISGSDTLDLLRGRLMPTSPMLDSIAELLSVQPAAVLGMMSPIPDGLRVGLSKRRFRNRVRELGRRLGSSDAAAWRSSAYGTLAMPYRTTGHLAPADWDARIERFLDVDQ
jgi:hypothetical protein